MKDRTTDGSNYRLWRRRSLLLSLLGLGAWLSLKKSAPLEPQTDKTVLAGGWVLKKSDLT